TRRCSLGVPETLARDLSPFSAQRITASPAPVVSCSRLLMYIFGRIARFMIYDSLATRKHAGPPPESTGYNVALKSSWLGVPFPLPVITPVVAFALIQFATVADGWSPFVAL